MSDSKNQLDQLIDSHRQDAQAQQAKSEAKAMQPVRKSHARQILAIAVLAVFAVVMTYQYPKFSEPYTPPDPMTNSAGAEANLLEVMSLIEIFRVSKGQYPAVLGEITLPDGLNALVASTTLIYTPTDTAYQLDWTLPHWRATFDSQTETVSVTPLAKR